MTFHSKLKEPNESIDSHVKFSERVLPLVTDTTSSHHNVPTIRRPSLPFFLLHSHMHRLICVVPLLIVDSRPELSISPSLAPCSFRIYVSRGLRMTPNVFRSVMSQFPKYPTPWPHSVDEVDSAKSKSWPMWSPIQFSHTTDEQ
jgi:hypothetical protein